MSRKRDLGSRVGMIDELRGLAIILMVFDHLFFDLNMLLGIRLPFLSTPFYEVLAYFFAGLLILLSGLVCNYSNSNLKRGAIALLFAFGITGVSLWIAPDFPIYFGVLHLLAFGMIFWGLLGRFLRKIPALPGMIVCALGAVWTWSLRDGSIGLPGVWEIPLPLSLYRSPFPSTALRF